MAKRWILIFLTIFLSSLLIFPQLASAEIQLPKEDSHYLLNSAQQGLINEWIDLTASPDFSEPEKQAALFLIRNAIQRKEAKYALKDLPREGLEGLIEIAAFFYFSPDIKAVIEKIEKETVKRAVEITTDWFLKNEIKIASGKLTSSFTSYKGNLQEPVFYYNLAYHSLVDDRGELVIEFYSPSEIEPAIPTGVVLSLGVSSWDFDTWRRQDKEKIKPFIVRIRGEVAKKSTGGYKWEKTLEVEVDFPDSMPEMPDLSKEESFINKIPVLGNYYRDLMDQIEKISAVVEKLGIIENTNTIIQNAGKSIKNSAGSIINRVKSYLSKINPFSPAAIVQPSFPSSSPAPSFSSITPVELEDIEEQITILEEEIAEVSPEKVEEKLSSGMSLAEIQEKLDDIGEMADIISREIAELLETEEVILEEEIEDIVEIAEFMELEEVEIEEVFKEDIDGVGKIDIKTLCKKTAGSLPKRNKVIINEVAWMGTKNSANDEWIELKNVSGSQINLSGWQILDKDEQIKVIFDGDNIILNNKFYFLERTDDSSVPSVIADLIYTGVLNDKNEALYLFDDECGLEDEIIVVSSWPAGNKSSRRSMERSSDLNWHTFYGSGRDGIFGTPKRENSSRPLYIGGGGPSPSPEEVSEPSPEVLITEVQIVGEESFYDFIELYNPATNSLDISGFQLKKKSSTGKEYSIRVFPEGSTILAQDYFVWLNSDYASSTFIVADVTSSQTLAKNNSIALFDKNGNILDSLAWGSSTNPFVETDSFFQNPEKNQSLGRKWIGSQGYQDTDDNQEDFEIQDFNLRDKFIPVLENQLPIALFTYFSSDLLIDQEVFFDAASSTDEDGEITSFIWDFGDGNSATTDQATTSYSYSTSSSYIASLVVIDSEGAASSPATTVIEIASRLTLGISPSDFIFETEEDGNNPESKILTIQNIGEEGLDWRISVDYATTSTSTWLSLNAATGTLPAFSSSTLEISVDISELKPGDYEAVITVEALKGNSELASVHLIVNEKEVPTLSVVINEIAWMGTKADPNDEWIELYNNTDEEINLEGWKIKIADKEINLTGVILPRSYFLLERTGDEAVSDVEADQIYAGVLGNGGEKLELRDAEDRLIDSVDCSSGWFAGRNQKIGENWVRMSMERVKPEALGDDSSNWITNSGFIFSGKDSEGNSIQGTPDQRNSRFNSSGTFLMRVSIPQDMIWTKKGSPYIIKKTLTIPKDITLLIEPGVLIEFVVNHKSRIEVEGTLKAIGTKEDLITFTSEREKTNNAAPQNWDHIHFTGPDSILENVIVRYGGFSRGYPESPQIFRGALFADNTDIIIRDSIIENNLVAGVVLNNSNSLIENTLFRNHYLGYYYSPRTYGHGITVAIYLKGSSNPVFNNLTFEGNAANIYPIPE